MIIFKNYIIKPKNSLSKAVKLTIIFRTMMQGRSIYVARAAYHCLTALTNPNVMDKTVRNNHDSLIDSTVDLSIDNKTGAIQHKSAFIRHMISHKFNGKVFYSNFAKKTGIQTIMSVEGQTDMRVMNELPVIHAYFNTFAPYIDNIQANHDVVPGDFYAQKQANQDFNVTIKSMFAQLMKPMSVRPDALIVRPHDEKSGMGMFKHATRGTIGMLTFDITGENNIQVMSSTTEMTVLIQKDKKHLYDVIESLKHDNIFVEKLHNPLLTEAINILNNSGNTFVEQQRTHNSYQQYMWDNFHANPHYPRSISFIFPVNVEYNHFAEQDPRYYAFKEKFSSLLQDKVYDLNKQSDCKAITFAMLRAYKDTVDPKIIEKLQHLQHVAGVTFNSKFILDLASLLKQGLL